MVLKARAVVQEEKDNKKIRKNKWSWKEMKKTEGKDL